jgi:hypothetical protein
LTSCSTGTDRSIPWRVRVSEDVSCVSLKSLCAVLVGQDIMVVVHTLQDLEVLNVCVLSVDVEFDTAHGHIHYMIMLAKVVYEQPDSNEIILDGTHTVDRVKDLAEGGTRASTYQHKFILSLQIIIQCCCAA